MLGARDSQIETVELLLDVLGVTHQFARFSGGDEPVPDDLEQPKADQVLGPLHQPRQGGLRYAELFRRSGDAAGQHHRAECLDLLNAEASAAHGVSPPRRCLQGMIGSRDDIIASARSAVPSSDQSGIELDEEGTRWTAGDRAMFARWRRKMASTGARCWRL
jgi:hypothetical protein